MPEATINERDGRYGNLGAGVIQGLLAMIGVCAFGIASFALLSVVDLKERAGISESRTQELDKKFERMDSKLDKILEYQRAAK